jgi:hypothetical protein
MWHKARAQPNESGAGRTHFLGRAARVWRIFENYFKHMSREVAGVGR